MYKVLQSLKIYDYDTAEILLKSLKNDLEKIESILSESSHEKDSIYFDVDLNRHLYVQVQTKPAEFMSFGQLVLELKNIFNEWEWLIQKIKTQNIGIWVSF